jgi:hypothetical protein
MSRLKLTIRKSPRDRSILPDQGTWVSWITSEDNLDQDGEGEESQDEEILLATRVCE